ncbi:hypothetical protein AMEX_G23216 [Astyanax mexicanus]|uniref:Rho-GAP domain-containing protein n=1 Tax=Astyanax mexicanus TaxID=7994 RepID=A0A8T2KWS8_ASTMX|nr:hypothetical protein AMEX_G23216 [Astyanax mexicanus]
MRAAPGQRERVLAVVRALKTAGIRVRNWKSFIQTQSQAEENLQPFAFGRELQLLPQRHVTELDGTVPLFLVEACEYLSQHLHTEGLFRKTGSLSRIRALRADLEQGEHIFCPPHDALLQACDVASVLKQFLRELAQPLIPVDLQGPLCQAQALELEHNFRGVQDRATLLLTALLPPAHARTLRYLCSFLSQVAQRCDENRMEVGNLALVMAPNLLQCPTQPCRLTLNTEKQLDQQTQVIKVLILHADRIGVLPSFVLDTLGSVEVSESTSPADGALFSRGAGLSVYRSLRRQRRKSVGEMFVDAFSKLKPGRTPTGPPIILDAPLEERLPSNGPTSQSPNTVKRKASDGSPLEVGGSATKRRSLHDLRVDTQSISSHSANVCVLSESTGSQSPQAMKNSKEDLHPNVSKRKSQVRANRKSYRPPKQENQVHCRRRSLRFFTMSNSGNSSPMHGTTADDHHEPCLSACRKLHDDKPQNSDSETSLKIPFILIDGPKTVVIGSEVDDDPDLLNCSFVENANDVLPPETPKTFPDFSRQGSEQSTGAETALEPSEVDADFDDHWVLLEDNSEVVVHYKVTHSNGETDIQAQATNDGVKLRDAVQIEEKDEQLTLQPKQTKKNSKKGPRPRRSISMPEVALETCSDENVQVQKVDMNTSAFDDIWMGSANLHSLSSSGGIKAGCKEKERQEQSVKRRHGSVLDRRKDKMTDSDPGLKRTRLSVANRLRSFSALAALLRTPRSGAPQLGHQSGTVRLRRQGARRFSRSFSHDGVPKLLSGESPQEDQQAFVELSDFYADSQDPDSQTHLDGFPDQTVLGTVFQSSPKQTSVEDLTLVSSPQSTEEEKQLLQFEEPESQSVCILSKSKARALDPEFDLHKLLEQQCHVADQGQDPIVLSPLRPGEPPVEICYDLSPPSQQQEEFSVSCMESPYSFSHHNTVSPQYSSFAEHYPDPDSTHPYHGSPSDHACLSLNGLISVSSSLSETCSLSLELSPPAFQFQPQVLKRRYRDSPRWPSHEVRMTMWKPLPL